MMNQYDLGPQAPVITRIEEGGRLVDPTLSHAPYDYTREEEGITRFEPVPTKGTSAPALDLLPADTTEIKLPEGVADLTARREGKLAVRDPKKTKESPAHPVFGLKKEEPIHQDDVMNNLADGLPAKPHERATAIGRVKAKIRALADVALLAGIDQDNPGWKIHGQMEKIPRSKHQRAKREPFVRERTHSRIAPQDNRIHRLSNEQTPTGVDRDSVAVYSAKRRRHIEDTTRRRAGSGVAS